MTMVRVLPDMVFSDVLDALETVYGQKTLFEYQDQGGRVVTVDEALKWDRFAAMADDRSPPHPSTPHPLPSTLCCRQCYGAASCVLWWCTAVIASAANRSHDE